MLLLPTRLVKPGCCFSPTISPRLAHAALCWNRLHKSDAHSLFDAVPATDHRHCSELLRARTANGDHSGSISLLRGMLGRGLRPDRLALAAAIKSASALRDGESLGRCLHGFVVRTGHAAGVAVAKAVMDMYGRCGTLADARLVFDEMSCPDTVCWNILITGSSRAGYFDDVFDLFRSMVACGADESMPTAVTVAVVIPVCAKLRVLRAGMSIHGYVVKTGLESDTLCGNALISLYAKCGGSGTMDDAHRAFSSIGCKDVVSWNSIIAGHSENGLFKEALALFGQMTSDKCLPNYSTVANILPVCSFMEHGKYYGKEVHGFVFRVGLYVDISVCNALMTHYSKVYEMRAAESIFRSMNTRDIITWNTIISGYLMNGYHSRVLDLFHRLLSTGMTPDSVSLISLLTACAQVGDAKGGMGVHGYIFRHPVLHQETSLMNSLVSFYSQCNRFDDALHAFADILSKDSISWNAILSACAKRGKHIEEFFKLFNEMCHEVTRWDSVTILNVVRVSNLCGSTKMVREAHGYSLRVGYIGETSVANAILDAYAKCGYPQDADVLFRNLAVRNIVTYNTMISCYLKNSSVEEAEIIFNQMSKKDQTTWNLMIQVYAQNGMCDQAFSLFRQLQCPDTISITNILLACIHLSLVQLVRQCHGYMLRASLEDIHLEGSLLDAYSKCGNITDAYNLFQVSPTKDLVTFTAMIGGYAIHAGLVDAGIKIFKSVREIYRIEPTAEHYTCMVDLLSRGGRLQDAYNFALDMPPHLVNANAWGSLIGACKVHGDVRIGQLAADQLFSMEFGDIGNYVTVSNIYAAGEEWDGVEHVRKLMKSKDMKKPAGCSQALS
ncbi:putative pentatricopeptide repeat-containing protein At5g08490 [Brachypodium distachyon]|uniref:putative pentatricopeptide repeat-containing protein At5g08490 n=1 Tax=Brachypodium distachyon TaxID=15368 RepID=UPI000D0DE33E|nr:putative pentatricopeptide repeat-containing protein At5g08490 [Brachypodium distachyon]|eukprot:XP_024311489.1 putative pentatricopeptide repeat-containing protein At5g08490 [Brachypodium distachyon]